MIDGNKYCQEYNCLDSQTKLVYSKKDDAEYAMCDSCAEHSIDNRGMILAEDRDDG